MVLTTNFGRNSLAASQWRSIFHFPTSRHEHMLPIQVDHASQLKSFVIRQSRGVRPWQSFLCPTVHAYEVGVSKTLLPLLLIGHQGFSTKFRLPWGTLPTGS